ncbi:MAG TPA: element excision factor XisH family protein, partial [Caldilineaceae bacterium]|nr:element excision factor XisH family protein [Caldilineaceae bacterium]
MSKVEWGILGFFAILKPTVGIIAATKRSKSLAAKDAYHEAVVEALRKDRWKITHDPLPSVSIISETLLTEKLVCKEGKRRLTNDRDDQQETEYERDRPGRKTESGSASQTSQTATAYIQPGL